MCVKRYSPPEMLPYLPRNLESALRLAAQERWDMVIHGQHRKKNERRSLK